MVPSGPKINLHEPARCFDPFPWDFQPQFTIYTLDIHRISSGYRTLSSGYRTLSETDMKIFNWVHELVNPKSHYPNAHAQSIFHCVGSLEREVYRS